MLNITESDIMQGWKGEKQVPIVSICCPTYNSGKYINAVVSSFLTQKTSFPFELVIGEDCSTDNTRTILKKYKKKYPNIINLVLYKKNVGGAKNLVNLWNLCKGKYIAHCDGDDLMLSSKLQKQYDFLENNLDCVIVHHPCDIINEHGKVVKKIKINNPRIYNGDISCLFLNNNIIFHSSKMFRTSCLDKGLLDGSISIILDWQIHILNAIHGNIGFINETLGLYRKNSNGDTSRFGHEKMRELRYKTLEYCRTNDIINKKVLNKAYHNYYINSAMYFARNRKIKQSFKEYFKAMKMSLIINRYHIKYFAMIFGYRRIKE